MSLWRSIRIAVALCVGLSGLWLGSATPVLDLVKRIPFSEIVNDQGAALKAEGIASPDPFFSMATEHPREGYGFIKGGKAFTPGWGGWVLDIETGAWARELPASLREVSVTKDGTKLYGRFEKVHGKGFDPFKVDTLTGKPWDGEMMMHPDNNTWVSIGWGKTTNAWIEEVSIGGRDVPLKGKYLSSVDGFTGDGRYLIVDKRQLIDTKTLRLLPVDPEMAEGRKQSDTYIGGSGIFVFNRDASWVAGFSSDFDSNDEQIALFILNRKARSFIWKGKTLGGPVAFSPNDAYLLTRAGYILTSATGEIAFKDLKGKSGKFSPDGRSLVTVDDEAFHIYTLPKDSGPIFGVFQKPEPWSPPKPAKRSRSSTKKPLKKP